MTIWIKSTPFIQLYIDEVNWEVREIEKIPRALLSWSMTQLGGKNGRLARQMAFITAKNGVPVDLLDSLVEIGIEHSSLPRWGLPLNNWQSVKHYVQSDSKIRLITQNLVDATKEISSEAETEAYLRSHVWDPLITELLLEPTRLSRKFKALTEWKVPPKFPEKTHRCVDWVAIVETFNIPVFFVEIDQERIFPDFFHKDFTELMCLMSQACFKLCETMRNNRRDPSVVRVYGLWIGRSQFQFCVAHPVYFENRKEKQINLSVHLSFPDHWRFDLFEGGKQLNCRNICCNYPADFGGLIGNFGGLKSQAVTSNPDMAEEADLKTSPNPYPSAVRSANIESFCKLKIFMNCLIDTIEQIDTNREDVFGQSFLSFVELSDTMIPVPLPLNPPQTQPQNHAQSRTTILEPRCETSFSIRKRNSFEAEFYQLFEKFHDYFPKLYNSHVDKTDPQFTIYDFEKMKPLTADGTLNSKAIHWGGPAELIRIGANLAVHVLFELLLLHERLGIVHSDISPGNIMLSVGFNIWKIIDFDQSMRIEDSLKVSRRGGTHDYTAPESLKSGIFTPASDVYSLGQVLLRYFYFVAGYDIEFEKFPQEVVNMTEEFRKIAGKLVISDPAKRCTVRQALREFFDFALKNKPEGFEFYQFGYIFSKVEEFLSE